MAGMTRAHIADPHLVGKLASGQEHRIRPCVGATHCMSGHRPSCLHNAATGRELKFPHVIPATGGNPRRVTVIGAGPAGLEAARVSAERGHDVIVLEAAPEPGGQVLIGAQRPWRQDLRGVIDWRVGELERRGVRMHLNTMAGISEVRDLEPDVVVVATGGIPDLDWLEGFGHCASAWDVLTGHTPLREEVLVYDGTGRHPALHAADRAASQGSRVTFATLDGYPAAELAYAERVAWKHRIYEHNLQTVFDRRLTSVRPEGNRLVATLLNEVTLREDTLTIDQVIVERGTLPADEIFHELRPLSRNDGVTDLDALLEGRPQPATLRPAASFELHRVGDAVSSRNIHAAVLDSLRLCIAI